MTNDFTNVYEDPHRAASYDRLEFPGTYYLAFRDLPAVFSSHIRGRRALDFGCGTGRSTRFLKHLGFTADGIDVSEAMLARARQRDAEGIYLLVPDDGLDALPPASYDLIFSAFTFDNIPTLGKKTALFRSLKRLLALQGRIVNLVSSPEIYVHEWVSFSTRDFPQNRDAVSGDRVSIIMLDVDDRRPVEDIVCSHDDYLRVYDAAGLAAVEVIRPLGRASEPYPWVSESTVAPWTVYVLRPQA
ncbi:MAG TPA: class I SAM-dependent methyltransferase [Bacteroidota bacterium]|nr:class I SAM-dependent methyltransferase [Bacteroidota bacterium]